MYEGFYRWQPHQQLNSSLLASSMVAVSFIAVVFPTGFYGDDLRRKRSIAIYSPRRSHSNRSTVPGNRVAICLSPTNGLPSSVATEWPSVYYLERGRGDLAETRVDGVCYAGPHILL
ncbi:hypothetical protein PROFUN_07477 [Planoprotostelium fungivorum]|uniref:Uncharacterized protein n=1 Tax=Planoprotostelium fungivorum TaxID=1890364 RepID=A0A2P6NLI4_9EUKA|nr:hypothetical protein PROFUN_07477 [Planoprotostelium fungivorum]